MGLKHSIVVTGTNDAAKQVSVNAWNADHAVVASMNFPEQTVVPTAPAAGVELFLQGVFQDWRMLASENAAGRVEFIAPHPWRHNVFRLVPGGGTTATSFAACVGCGFTGTASSFSAQVPAAGSAVTLSTRYTCATSTSTSNVVDIRPTSLLASRTSGFSFAMTFQPRVLSAANRAFFGLLDVTTAPGNIDWTTTTTQNRIGIAINSNTGNWKLITGVTGTAATVVDLGVNFPVNTTDMTRLSLFCTASDTSTVYYRVENLTSGLSTSGTITANLPSATVLLAPHQYLTNNTNGTAVSFDSTGWYLQTDTV